MPAPTVPCEAIAGHPDFRRLDSIAGIAVDLRPQRVQEQLWAALQGTNLLTYIADPVRGSLHSFGMALDLTPLDAQGRELDMGAGFDDLSAAHIENRLWLRNAMHHNGWHGINTEWWHFDSGDRMRVRQHYTRVL